MEEDWVLVFLVVWSVLTVMIKVVFWVIEQWCYLFVMIFQIMKWLWAHYARHARQKRAATRHQPSP